MRREKERERERKRKLVVDLTQDTGSSRIEQYYSSGGVKSYQKEREAVRMKIYVNTLRREKWFHYIYINARKIGFVFFFNFNEIYEMGNS